MNQQLVVCYGELLWDLLPSGPQPGGAPMNVAYHLHKLGCDPAIITRVGADERGDALLELLHKKGIGTTHVQTDPQTPTGIAVAQQNAQGDVQYDIVAPAAWDHIEGSTSLRELVAAAGYFVFGSLITRHQTSRDTLFELLESAQTKVLDINLRAPHYNRALINALLMQADILKMNEEELQLVAGWFSDLRAIEDQLALVRDRFGISTIIITRGANGALLHTKGASYHHPGYKVPVTDTVGSGDAFLAGALSMLIKKEQPEQLLDLANRLAAIITTHKGACPDYDIKEADAWMSDCSL
jgi:fructokinase